MSALAKPARVFAFLFIVISVYCETLPFTTMCDPRQHARVCVSCALCGCTHSYI